MTHTSVKRTMQLIDSAEFGEWLAFAELEKEEANGRPPTDEEFEAKMDAWAARVNAARAARG